MKTFLFRGAANMNYSVSVDNPANGRHYPLPEYHGICKHSPDGFSWGYSGSGPSQLAFALVYYLTSDLDFTKKMYMRLRDLYIARLDKDSDHEVTEKQIVTALRQIAVEQLSGEDLRQASTAIREMESRIKP